MQKSNIVRVSDSAHFVPLDCPLCSFLLRDFQDCMQYLETECCTECWVGFLEPLRKLNENEEYVPISKEIATWREKVSPSE